MLIKCCPRSIFLQVMIDLVIGVICGIGASDLVVQMKPLGNGFIKLVKMLIALIILCVVINGISGAGDLKKVDRIDLKSVIYLEVFTTIALVLGLAVVYNLGLGDGANIHLNELPAGDVALYTRHTQEIHGPVAFLVGLILTSVFSTFAESDILQVLLFSMLFGNALDLIGEQASSVARLINEFSHIMSRIMGMIVRLTPLGAFGVVAFTAARYDVDSLSHLGALMPVFYATYLIFVTAVLGSVLRLSGVRILPFLYCFREKLMIVMDTASSDTVLPQVIRKLEHMGIRSSTVGLMIPTDYSFDLNGFPIYLTLAMMFIAHVTGTPLAMTDLVIILLISLVTSEGAHDIPGSALVILAATFTTVPAIPVADLVLVLSADWSMSTGHALTNLVGNCVTTMTIARQKSDIDMLRAQAILGGRLEAPTKADGEPLRRSAVAGKGELHG